MIVHLTRLADAWEARVDGDAERSQRNVLPHLAVRDALDRHAPDAIDRDTVVVQMRTQDLRPRRG